MTKSKTVVFWVVFSGLCLLGGLIMLFPGYRFSAYITFSIAAILLCYRLLQLLQRRCPRFSKTMRWILTIGICLVLVAASITGGLIAHAAKGSDEDSCDYLIVLGAGVNGTVPSLTLRERLDAAYTYLLTHEDTICIVSGGQGPGEDITEAECMANWLTEKGIEAHRILLESQATSTRENLAFSLALMEAHTQNRAYQVGIVSSEYHLYRAGLMAQAQGIRPVLIPAKTSWLSLRINYYMREIAGVWYYAVFGD